MGEVVTSPTFSQDSNAKLLPSRGEKGLVLTKCFYILTQGSPLAGLFFSPCHFFIVFWWFRDPDEK